MLKELDILGVRYALFVYVLYSSQLLFGLSHFSFVWNTQVNLLYSDVIIMPSSPLKCCPRHSVYALFVHLSVTICYKLVNVISYINQLWEFHQIFTTSVQLVRIIMCIVWCVNQQWLTNNEYVLVFICMRTTRPTIGLEFKVKRPQSHRYRS